MRTTKIVLAILCVGFMIASGLGVLGSGSFTEISRSEPISAHILTVGDHYWIGTTTDPTLNTNWQPATVPSTGQNIFFSALSTGNCQWTLTGSYGSFSLLSNFTYTVTDASSFTVSGYSQAAGTFTGSGSNWLTDSGNFVHTGGTITPGIVGTVNLKMNLSGATIALATSSQLLRNLTILQNASITSAVDDVQIGYDLTIAAGATLTLSSKPMTWRSWNAGILDNEGTIAGTRIFYIGSKAGSPTITKLGAINSPLSFYAPASSTGSSTVTLTANLILGNTLTIKSDHATYTMTLDLSASNYTLSATSIFPNQRGIINCRGSVVSSSGDFDSYVGGTVIAGTSKLVMSGTTKALRMAAGQSLYDLSFTGTISLNSNITVNHNFSISQPFSLLGHTLDNSGGFTYCSSDFTFLVAGTFKAGSSLIVRGSIDVSKITFISGQSTSLGGSPQAHFSSPQNVIVNTGYHIGDTMVKASNGDYLAFIRYGTTHVSPGDYAIMKLYRSTDNGVTWSYLSTPENVSHRDVRNYASVISSTGRIFVFFSIFDTDNFSGNDEAWHDLHYIFSDNNGASWSSAIDIINPTINGLTPLGSTPYHAAILNSGRIAVTIDAGNLTYSQVRLLFSDNNGATWNQIGITNVTKISILWRTEMSFVYVGSDRVIAMVRVEGTAGQWMYTSADNGQTWNDRGFGLTETAGVRSPLLIPFLNLDGKTWVLGIFIYNSLYYSISSADTLMTNGILGWPTATYVGNTYGRYASVIPEPSFGDWFVFADKEISASRSDCLSWRVSRESITLSQNQQFKNLTIGQNGGRLNVTTGNLIRIGGNLTINSGCSLAILNNSYVLKSVVNNGVIYQNGGRMNITGTSQSPLTGYGLFDGNIYLNGSAASNYQVQTGLPMGTLHSDRNTKINFNATRFLRVVPSPIAFFSITSAVFGQWTIGASGAAKLTFILSGQQPGQKYEILVDGNRFGFVLAASNGTVSFAYSGPWSSHTFSLRVYYEGSPSSINAAFTLKANGLKVAFQDNSQGHGIYKWLWDFGDGTTSTKQDPSHTYAKPGSYRVTLTVMNADGMSDTITKTVTVSGIAAGPQLLSLSTMLAFGLMFGGAMIIIALRRPAAIIVGVLAFVFGILLIFLPIGL